RRMVVVGRHERDAVPQTDTLRALAAGGEEHLRGRGVRVLLQEVVLDLPRDVDPEAIGELHLLERVLEQPVLVAVAPRARDLVLVEDAELHVPLPYLVPSVLPRRPPRACSVRPRISRWRAWRSSCSGSSIHWRKRPSR